MAARAIRLALGLTLMAASSASGQGDDPFEATMLDVPGRVVAVRATEPGPGCEGRGRDLLVISLSGTPPDDLRTVSLLACPKPGAPPRPRIQVRVDRTVVGVDAGPLDGEPGAEIALLSARAIDVLRPGGSPESPEVTRTPLPYALPLPRLSRELLHLPMLDDWNADGRPTALVPSVDGGLLIRLDDGSHRELAMPIESDYEPSDPSPPGSEREWLRTWIEWPTLMRADDDGDGRLDLFAMSRFDIWIFRAGDDGLPTEPTRRLALRPFTTEQELRWQSAEIDFTAADLDGDGRADLVLDKSEGNLLASQSTTEIHRGAEGGVSLVGPPDGRIQLDGGIAAAVASDLDGDGRFELFESSVGLGVVQLGRLLITRRASVDFRVHQWTAKGELETVWSDSVALTLDFGTGRIDGIFPDTRGDFDGDGRRDLVVPTAERTIGIRLGTKTASGAPGFGPLAAEREIPMQSASSWIADVDGNGFDDLILWDSRDFATGVTVLHNGGRLGLAMGGR